MKTSTRVPLRSRGATVDSLSRAFHMVTAYHQHLEQNVRDGMGLLLFGSYGVGKTWAMSALTNAYVSSPFYARDVEFLDAADLFEKYDTLDQSVDSYRGQPWSHTLHTVPWLVIDDLGKEYNSGKLAEQIAYKFTRIIRARNQCRLVTHITTNLLVSGASSMQERYGEAAVSLLSEVVRAFKVTGPDKRRAR